jgi:hypothetical protein
MFFPALLRGFFLEQRVRRLDIKLADEGGASTTRCLFLKVFRLKRAMVVGV